MLAACSNETTCIIKTGSEIGCRPGDNLPPPSWIPKGAYYKSCDDHSEAVPGVPFVMVVTLEPIETAKISCFYDQDGKGIPKGRVEHRATDAGFSYTMPCMPDWSDTAGRTAVLQYDGED